MPARRNTIRRDEPMSLRRGESRIAFSDEQLLIFAVLVAAIVQGGHGIYLKLSADGSSLRVKIYTDDDSYQDNVAARDDVAYLCADYADQMKVRPIYDALLAMTGGATPPAGDSATRGDRAVPTGGGRGPRASD